MYENLTNSMGIPKVYNPITGEYEEPDMAKIADLLNVAGVPMPEQPASVQPSMSDLIPSPASVAEDAKRAAGVEFLESMDPGSRVAVDYDPTTGAKTRVKIDGSRQPAAQGSGDPAADRKALEQAVFNMMKPGFRAPALDPAYSSVEYERGMPIEKVMQSPEYKQLQLALQLEKQKKDALPTPVKVDTPEKERLFKMYQTMPDGKEKDSFGRMIGVSSEDKVFSPEAKLAADLKNKKITQEEYDTAMAGTPGGKLKMERDAKSSSAITTAQSGIDLIDEMIGRRDEKGKLLPNEKEHGGFQSYVGATMFPGLRFIEGTDTASFQAREEQLKGKAMLEAYQYLRGTGAISNVEGKAATAALNRMGKALSEDEYVKAATEFRSVMASGIERYKRQSPGTTPSGGFGNTQQAGQAGQGGWAIRPKGQ